LIADTVNRLLLVLVFMDPISDSLIQSHIVANRVLVHLDHSNIIQYRRLIESKVWTRFTVVFKSKLFNKLSRKDHPLIGEHPSQLVIVDCRNRSRSGNKRGRGLVIKIGFDRSG